jgi:molecular chaperone GrpE
VSPDTGFSELATRLADVEERLLTEQEESGRLREALLRKSADFDNLRRRAEKEKTDFFKFALSEVFSDLLEVLDNFERALQHLSNGDEAAGTDVHFGIEMISRQFGDVLKKYGLEEVPGLGLPFDPNVHEAVVREETAGISPGIVLAVLQRGYVLNGRLLRPAKVKVAAAPPAGIGED